jgi:hypothetical protein
MKTKCALRKKYDGLVRKHRTMSDQLDVLQAVMGLGYTYDSQVYTDYLVLGDTLQGIAEALNIKRRRKCE